jgi:ABC-type bacteriocin/lantibiotic exporter with double-glycine peptidase domain
VQPDIRWVTRPFFRLTFLLLSACVTAPHPDGVTLPPVHLSVPFFSGEDRLCGPASLAAVFAFFEKGDRPISPNEIAQTIFLPELNGTLTFDLTRFARSRGYETQSYAGKLSDLHRHLREGVPPIVFLDLGYPSFPAGHFVVVTGLDSNGVIAHSGPNPNEHLSHRAFMAAWKKTGYQTLAITPKPMQNGHF